MIILGYILFGVYVGSMLYVTFYCLLQLNLLYHYKKNHVLIFDSDLIKESNELLPFITIQLPLFNEKYVVERLIDNITKLDYPKGRFEIHVLDDSTDNSVDISRRKVKEYQEEGFNIELITRENRQGYKAGALKDAMPFANGELIAIFDADFLPNPDFLRKTISYFENPEIGVVQTRWEHINEDYSILTRLQAFQLNVHFSVEQQGRESGGLLLQFNGTAGLWRKKCIEHAGGWEADTLTEDLDLSYRAQLKGWKIIFLEEVGAPAELPVEMTGLKSQQYRWMKGGAETAKKILPTILKADLSIYKKIHAVAHLLGSSVFIFVFLIGIFSVPTLMFINPLEINPEYLTIFLISLLAIIAVYYNANVATPWDQNSWTKKMLKFILIFPVFLALSMGLSFHNSIAVFQGWRGRKSGFVRTPKFNVKSKKDTVGDNQYFSKKLNITTLFEGLLCLYFVFAIYLGFRIENFSFLIFHILLSLGYGSIFYYSMKNVYQKV